MGKKLIQRIEETGLHSFYYNTACLKVAEGNDFEQVYETLLSFVKETIKEEGCIEFFAAPNSLEDKEILLWEVWKDETALQNHMNEEYTKKIMSENLLELKWNKSVKWK